MSSWIVPIAFLVYGIWVHNKFLGLRQRLDNAFSDIDVQLKRRWDLVTPLVALVRGYAGHEKETLEKVIAARGQAMKPDISASAMEQRGRSEADLATALRGVFILVENYPALKADQNFLELHTTLVKIEDDIQYARRYFNAVVRDFNTLRQRFPSSFVGAWTGVKLAEYFQLEDDERAVPAVDLDQKKDSNQEG